MAEGIGLIFDVAESESAAKGFAGLTLLSQVCEEQLMPNVHAMSPASMLAPSRRVGLRDPCNEERATITLLPAELPRASGHNPRTVYTYFCKEFGIKVNSVLSSSLGNIEDEFDKTTVISGKGNLVGDRGLLPVLELARYCPNLKDISFPDNGLKNNAVEALVHMLLDRSTTEAAADGGVDEAAANNKSVAGGFVAPACSNSIQKLDLSGNRITIGGGKLLVDLVKARPNIVELNVTGTKIDEVILKQLTLALETNRSKQQQQQEEIPAAS